MIAARLGPSEIFAPLGAGGVGEVYRARAFQCESPIETMNAILGRSLCVGKSGTSMSVSRTERDTGRRAPWRAFSVPDPAGASFYNAALTPDGRSSAYTYCCLLDDLYLLERLR